MSRWDLADAVFPYAHLFHIRDKLKRTDPSTDEVDVWYALLESGPDAEERSEIARGILKADSERLIRLETKLDGQRTILTAISPVTTVVIGAALGDKNLAAIALGAFAAMHVILAVLVALQGSAAAPRFSLTTDAYREVLKGTRKLSSAVAAVELAAVDANRMRGVWLNNWLTCAQTSAAWAVIATAAALVVLLPSHFPATP